MSYDEPTRVMRGSGGGRDPRQPTRGAGGPPDNQQIGRLRLIIACLGAVIVGLLIALLAGAGGGGETTTVTETIEAQATEPTATTPTGTTEEQQGDETNGTGGVSPEVPEDDAGTTDEIPDSGGEVLPDPDLGDETTAPSGGISPEG